MREWMIAASVIALASCATASPQHVSDADLGRLTPEQAQPIQAARQEVFRAQDDLNRAKLALQEARHESDLANADGAGADADAKGAEAQKKAAEDTHDAKQLDRARRIVEMAQLHMRSADAHKDYANKAVAYREEDLNAKQKAANLADAKLELAKLHAVQQSDVAAGTRYDGAAIQNGVTEAQKAYDDEMHKVEPLRGQSDAAQAAWQGLRQQYEASAQAAQQG